MECDVLLCLLYIQLVEQDSACLVGIYRNSLDCAHVMMNKFAPNTPDFLRVRTVIVNFVNSAEEILAQRGISKLSSQDKLYINNNC